MKYEVVKIYKVNEFRKLKNKERYAAIIQLLQNKGCIDPETSIPTREIQNIAGRNAYSYMKALEKRKLVRGVFTNNSGVVFVGRKSYRRFYGRAIHRQYQKELEEFKLDFNENKEIQAYSIKCLKVNSKQEVLELVGSDITKFIKLTGCLSKHIDIHEKEYGDICIKHTAKRWYLTNKGLKLILSF